MSLSHLATVHDSCLGWLFLAEALGALAAVVVFFVVADVNDSDLALNMLPTTDSISETSTN